MRDFEDYELIAGFEYFWILKAKGVHENLMEEMNNVSKVAYMFSFLFSTGRYTNDEIIYRMQDLRYGGELLKYINDKNITGIQLSRKEYVAMSNSKNAEYNCRKRITNPETIRFAREFENNPYTPSARDLMYAFYKSIGMDVEYDEIFARE